MEPNRKGGLVDFGQIHVQLVRREGPLTDMHVQLVRREGPLTDLYVNIQKAEEDCEIESLLNNVYVNGYDISPVFIFRGWE